MNAQPSPSVLIVEDECIIATDIRQSLQSMGYDAFAIATSAEEALARVSERCPDIVLMDIKIEGSRDGIEAARLLNALHDVPVIFLSAHSDDLTLQRAKRVGPYAFLSKPVKPADLRGAIETSLYRQAMDRRLRERERWFATVLGCVPDAVVTIDLAGVITYLNPAAARMLGTDAEQAVGKPIEEIMELIDQSPPSGDATPLAACLRLGQPVRIASAQLVNRRTGDRFIISDTSAPIYVDGKMTGAVMVFHDDTEKLAVARQLEITNRLAALGTMAAGTAHELNNPLAIITSRADNAAQALSRLMASGGGSDRLGEVSGALADMQAAAGRMSRIIADLRSVSRPPQQAIEIVDLARCIDWATRATAHEFHNRARVVQHLGVTPRVRADEARLGQVLVNLLVNAAHAIAPGHFEHNEVSIATRTDDAGRAVISVRDTGQGMTPEILKRIFDPFFTTKEVGEGTGLGLAISHGIMTSLGGELRAESTPGAGSTFEVVLPPAPATSSAASAERASPAKVAAAHPGRILVIDDEDVLLKAITAILELDGHTVVARNSARDALAMVLDGERFDVILSDVAMPNMTGIEFWEALQARDPGLAGRVIFLSGGAVTEKAQEFLERTAGKFIGKPFKSELLRRMVQQAIDAARAGEPPASPAAARTLSSPGTGTTPTK